MLTTNTKNKIIELRAQDHSYDSIAAEVKASKPTVMKVVADNTEVIEGLSQQNTEDLAAVYSEAQSLKTQSLIRRVKKTLIELESRDLSDVKTTDLVKMVSSLSSDLGAAAEGLSVDQPPLRDVVVTFIGGDPNEKMDMLKDTQQAETIS